MAERTGAGLKPLKVDVRQLPSEDVQWVDIPGGVVHRRLPYLWPVNAPDTWLLNLAKFKAHGMGLTLSCKNVQGTVALSYQRFCAGLRGFTESCDAAHVHPTAGPTVLANYVRHRGQGIPRWARPGAGDGHTGGLQQEIWATRTLHNLSVTRSGLCVIEGIYGRDGDAFLLGPNPPGNENNKDGQAWDYMSNVLIFGKDPFRVDIIGHWLGGHEPGNFGLFHLARQRGMSTALNPHRRFLGNHIDSIALTTTVFLPHQPGWELSRAARCLC